MSSRVKCSFRKCELSKSAHPELHFFSFPVKDKQRCIEWLINCQRPMLGKLPPEKLSSRIVCELHFESHCFVNTLKQKLNGYAIPTLDNSIQSLKQNNEYSANLSPLIYINIEKELSELNAKQTISKSNKDISTQTTFNNQKIYIQNYKRSVIMNRMRAKISHLKKKNEKIRNRQLSREELLEQIRNYFTDEAFVFLQMQLMHIDPGQWRSEERELALKMYYKSPELYNFLREHVKLKLPTLTTIRKWKKDIIYKNDNNINNSHEEIPSSMIEVEEIVFIEQPIKEMEIYENLDIPVLSNEEILIQ